MDAAKPDPEAVASWIADARERWPRIALDADAFAKHLASLDRAAPAFAADAYLAAACAADDPAALRVLDDEIVARVPSMVRRVDATPAFGDEMAQAVRVRLLVKEADSAPRIARFNGDVPLAAWVRVVALRLALNAKRGGGTAPPPDDHVFGPAEDPELDYLRARYKEPFTRAFGEALAALSDEDRTILRLQYVDGLNIEGIGRIYGVHRATVARWLARIRSEVLEAARTRLATELGADADEAESVIGVLGGELEMTLSRVLGRAVTSMPVRDERR
jgi:RNA polymerase sigma-70 factor (ECF subfamily)